MSMPTKFSGVKLYGVPKSIF